MRCDLMKKKAIIK